jgi:Kef-type K+ transport system membrane component KefB
MSTDAISEPPLRFSLPAYALMLLASIVLFALICWTGQHLENGASAAAPPAPAPAGHASLGQLLAALAAILTAGWVVGKLLGALGQPPVMGEMLAGIALGPSLLGIWVPAEAWLPGDTVAMLETVAQIGIILYLFLVGLELNTQMFRGRVHASVAVSHASIVAPFLLGGLLALWLYPNYALAGQPFSPFALFLGVALAVTAFPVLARILSDCGLEKTPLGIMALGCAAADDLTAWCLLALVVGLARSAPESALLTVALALGYVVLLLAVVRPLVASWLPRFGARASERTVTVAVFLGLLAAALLSEAIGVHALFGAFLAGAIIPHDSAVARRLSGQLRDGVILLLLPAFFACTGLKTQIGLLDSVWEWLVCLVIIAVATLGKVGGTYGAARWSGLDRRTAAALGMLMNTRGLMGLVVLRIGLDLGVLSPRLFAMMVVMALVTTLATTPILRRLLADTPHPGGGS